MGFPVSPDLFIFTCSIGDNSSEHRKWLKKISRNPKIFMQPGPGSFNMVVLTERSRIVGACRSRHGSTVAYTKMATRKTNCQKVFHDDNAPDVLEIN